MNLARLLTRTAARHGERPAVAVGTTVRHTWSSLAARVAAMAGGLRARLGVEPGDRVALFLPNGPEFVEALLATWHAGACAVPVNPKLHPRELAHILGDCGARACVVGRELLPALADVELGPTRLVVAGDDVWRALSASDPVAVNEVSPRDPCWLFYTSGTTGLPKGAMLSHRNMAAMATAFHVDLLAVDARDAIVHAGLLTHGTGAYLVPFLAKGAVQVIPESRGFDPSELVALASRWGRASCFLAPTMLARVVASPEAGRIDPARFGLLAYGGAPANVPDVREALRLFGPRLANVYGQGEAPMTITALTPELHVAEPERLGTVGVARTGVEVSVRDGDRAVDEGEVGEVCVRGDIVMEGYWAMPEATRAATRGSWLRTGDLGALDAKGFLTLSGRSKDVIISGGTNIYPQEVVRVLEAHPAVAEAAVVGRPSARWGEEPVAFVALREGAGVDAGVLTRHCLEHLARFKRPRDVVFVDALPKNPTGKVLLRALRARLDAGDGSAA